MGKAVILLHASLYVILHTLENILSSSYHLARFQKLRILKIPGRFRTSVHCGVNRENIDWEQKSCFLKSVLPLALKML